MYIRECKYDICLRLLKKQRRRKQGAVGASRTHLVTGERGGVLTTRRNKKSTSYPHSRGPPSAMCPSLAQISPSCAFPRRFHAKTSEIIDAHPPVFTTTLRESSRDVVFSPSWNGELLSKWIVGRLRVRNTHIHIIHNTAYDTILAGTLPGSTVAAPLKNGPVTFFRTAGT